MAVKIVRKFVILELISCNPKNIYLGVQAMISDNTARIELNSIKSIAQDMITSFY